MTRIVGQGNSLYLLETGEEIGAERAYEMGLVQELVPSGRALSRAMELADRIAAYPQRSLLADREAALGTWGRSLEDGLAFERAGAQDPALREELAEGARGFVEGRERDDA